MVCENVKEERRSAEQSPIREYNCQMTRWGRKIPVKINVKQLAIDAEIYLDTLKKYSINEKKMQDQIDKFMHKNVDKSSSPNKKNE